MGLFSRRISQHELEYVNTRLTQLQNTIKLVNTTVKPDIFFKRFNFMFDILLDLSNYEKYKVFKGEPPSAGIIRIKSNLYNTVDDFITRFLNDNLEKQRKLKTERGKKNCYDKSIIQLISAFDCASTFWTGDKGLPHYNGPLYTADNYKRVQDLFYSLDD